MTTTHVEVRSAFALGTETLQRGSMSVIEQLVVVLVGGGGGGGGDGGNGTLSASPRGTPRKLAKTNRCRIRGSLYLP